MSDTGDSTIHLAFRFHVNLYHSYRGDSLDERGIGKDIRIIRALLDELDALGAEGRPVRAAWDIENFHSLERYLPRHAPDIVERIRGRVASGLDEVEPMSYNNGLLCAHRTEEFEEALALAVRNPGGSGLADLFGEWAPILRPQECMFSSSRIPSCRKLGIEAVSVFYGAAPFNGFASFVPPLSLAGRYNPLEFVDAASGQSIRMIPAYSPADIVENWCSLRRWLRRMRREQLASKAPDLLLLLDMDADDSFWEGYLSGRAASLLRRFLPSLGGFGSLVRSVADLPWLRFSRPWDYLRSHGNSGEIRLGQDLADGSFDGYSSWSEKAENARLWPRVALARRLLELAGRIAARGKASPEGSEACCGGDSGLSGDPAVAATAFDAAAAKARMAILLSLSTTHFGMASPVMNADRLREAFARAEEAVAAARAALDLALSAALRPASDAERAGERELGHDILSFDPRIDCLPMGEGAILRLPGCGATFGGDAFGDDGATVGCGADMPDAAEPEQALAVFNPPGSWTELRGALRDGSSVRDRASAQDAARTDLRIGKNSIATGKLELTALPGGALVLSSEGRPVFEKPLSGPWLRFAGGIRRDSGETSVVTREVLPGKLAELRTRGSFELEPGAALRWENVFTLAAGLSSLRVDVGIEYPRTERRGFDRAKARRLGRDWDARWKEVAPFELVPALGATLSNPARVWKHGFDGDLSSYALDYHRFGPNRDLDSFDNHLTDGWVAISGGGRGFLLAQSDSAQTLFAFCPMRLRVSGERQILAMNPFGSYHGRQWRYPTASTGLGRLAALATGDNFDPYAPSWEGESLRFSLMIAPYAGDCPPASLQRDALVFATGPIALRGLPGA
jgi:hypothetical protein